MTQIQFEKKNASILNTWAAKMIQKFRESVRRLGEAGARAQWRETYGLVFIEEYTVKARFRHYKKFPWGELPESSKKTLNAQEKAKHVPKTAKAKSKPNNKHVVH